MTTLLETLKQGMLGSQPSGPQANQASEQDQTAQIQKLSQAKTGKDIGPSTTAGGSSLQEKLARAGTSTELGKLGEQRKLQSAQLDQRASDISQRGEQQTQQFQQQAEGQNQQFTREIDSILNQFEQGQKRMDNAQDVADLEKVGAMARLDNQKYVQNLQDIGKKQRFDNQLDFKKQVTKQAFQDQQGILSNELAFEAAVGMDDRTFAETMSKMDINYAMQVSENAINASNKRAMYKGIGDATTGGLKALSAAGPDALDNIFSWVPSPDVESIG